MRILSSQIKGLGLGKKELVPTINLVVPSDLSMPYGIYASFIKLITPAGKQILPAVMHYGPRPVLQDSKVSLEIHILTMTSLPTYDSQHIEVETIQYLRNIREFSSLKELMKQIEKDTQRAQGIFDTLT